MRLSKVSIRRILRKVFFGVWFSAEDVIVLILSFGEARARIIAIASL